MTKFKLYLRDGQFEVWKQVLNQYEKDAGIEPIYEFYINDNGFLIGQGYCTETALKSIHFYYTKTKTGGKINGKKEND